MKGEERREFLKQYVLTCVRDSALTWSDLMSPRVFDKLLAVLSKDVKVVLVDLGRTGGADLIQMGAAMLAGFAQNAVKRK
jgi:hypothetical protein